MRHRIFIAINLPEKIKNRLARYETKWLELPVQWTKKDNLHITLQFLGYVSDNDVMEIYNIVKQVSLRQKSFIVNLNSIAYGPKGKNPPRMIWAVGETSPEFTALKNDLEKSLIQSPNLPENTQAFSPHITLGRIRTWDFRKIEPEERPKIKEEIALSFEAESIEIMESVLKRKGPSYTILESCQLKS